MPRDRMKAGLARAGWLVADAAIAASIAGPAETLLLFLVSPDRPLTLRDFVATLLALTPQILIVFVLLGPALVLAGISLSVGRSTTRGISLRYVMRFATLDAGLLGLAALWQWFSLGPIVPEPGRSALALTTTALIATAAVLAVLAARDAWRPGGSLGPWLAAIAVGIVVALSISGGLRRDRHVAPRAIDLPGFEMARPVLLLEVPGLDPGDLQRYRERGEVPAVDALAARGYLTRVDPAPAGDTLAAHATLLTGVGPGRHGVLRSSRFQPWGDRRSFAVLPEGLAISPLLRTPLWRTIPVGHEALRVVALPDILAALRPAGRPGGRGGRDGELAILADPLDWPEGVNPWWTAPAVSLVPGAAIPLPDGAGAASCPDPGDVRERFFDPPAAELAGSEDLAVRIRASLSSDRCALLLAANAIESGFSLVHVRLGGHGDVARQFAGYRASDAARGVPQQEIDAYGRVLTRYFRELDPAIGRLIESAEPQRLIALVAPHGIESRQDFTRLIAHVVGLKQSTAGESLSPPGVLLLAGAGVARTDAADKVSPLASVLPTLMFAADLPVAADMGPILQDAFEREFLESRPIVTVPSYTAAVTAARRGR